MKKEEKKIEKTSYRVFCFRLHKETVRKMRLEKGAETWNKFFYNLLKQNDRKTASNSKKSL